MEAVHRKGLPKPGIASFDTTEAANEVSTFCLFVKKYKTDEVLLLSVPRLERVNTSYI